MLRSGNRIEFTDTLIKNQISPRYRYIENTCTLAILQISDVYHNSFQIMDYIMTNLQKIRLAKNLDYRASILFSMPFKFLDYKMKYKVV